MQQEHALTSDEIYNLEETFSNAKASVTKAVLIYLAAAVVLSVIPLGFLPKGGRLDAETRSQNLFEALGFLWWLVAVGTLGAVFLLAYLADLRYAGLQKDRKEQVKITGELKVTEIINDTRNDIYALKTNAPVKKLRTIRKTRAEITQFYVGQPLSYEVYKHSCLPVA